jgi:hypothetical protein
MNTLTIDDIPLRVISDILRFKYEGIGKDTLDIVYLKNIIELVYDFYTFPTSTQKDLNPIGTGKMIYPNPPEWLEG